VIKIKTVNPGGDYSEAMQVRYAVFVEEQGVPHENEVDEYDKTAYHVVMTDNANNDKPIACGRLYFLDDIAKLGRVAVISEYRRKGFAIEICKELIYLAKSHGAKKVVLHSQTYVVPLYEKLGFKCVGDEFSEENIPHFKMELVFGKESLLKSLFSEFVK